MKKIAVVLVTILFCCHYLRSQDTLSSDNALIQFPYQQVHYDSYTKEISFPALTYYEICDTSGVVIKNGVGYQIDMSIYCTGRKTDFYKVNLYQSAKRKKGKLTYKNPIGTFILKD
jgi:hypothetical protein